MSTSFSSDIRMPLSPVAEPNLLSDVPPALDLPDVFKGENVEAEAGVPSRTVSRSTPTPTTLGDHSEHDCSPASEGSANVITPIQVPPEAMQGSLGAPLTTDTAATQSPDSERDWDTGYARAKPPDDRQSDNSDNDDTLVCEAVEEDAQAEESAEDEDAVLALLSLQRVPSVVDMETRTASISDLSRVASTADLCFDSVGTASPRGERAGEKRRAASPYGGDYAQALRDSPVPKFAAGDGDSRYFCRYPNCGKGYASTDAVRKHCRQRHLEWLRRLGHGCPALYCRWGEATAEH